MQLLDKDGKDILNWAVFPVKAVLVSTSPLILLNRRFTRKPYSRCAKSVQFFLLVPRPRVFPYLAAFAAPRKRQSCRFARMSIDK